MNVMNLNSARARRNDAPRPPGAAAGENWRVQRLKRQGGDTCVEKLTATAAVDGGQLARERFGTMLRRTESLPGP